MTTTPPPGAPQHGGLDSFFDALRRIDVRRSDDGWVGGVAAGLAARLGVDPVVVRGAFLLLSMVFGIGATVYLVAWLLVPQAGTGVSHLERALSRGDGVSILLLVLTALSVFSPGPLADGSGWGWGLGSVVLLALLAWGAWTLWRDREEPGRVSGTGADGGPATDAARAVPPPPGSQEPFRTAPPLHGGTAGTEPDLATLRGSTGGAAATSATAPPSAAPPRRTGGPVLALLALGLALVTTGGLSWLATNLGWPGNPYAVAAAGTLAVMGVVVLLLGLAGRRAGFPGGLAVLALVAAVALAALPEGVGYSARVGSPTWAPTTLTEEASYELGVGHGVLDLTRLDPAELEGQVITTSVGIGELEVLVPRDVTVEVRGRSGIGAVEIVGALRDPAEPAGDEGGASGRALTGGLGASDTQVVGSGPVDLVVEAGVGVGQVTAWTVDAERS